MTSQEFRYTIDSAGQVFTPADLGARFAGLISFEGAKKRSWLTNFQRPERDLLRVMAGLLAADRLSPRRDNERAPHKLCWQRNISICIAVEDPDRWRSASSQVADLLRFMTDDAWSLDFDSAAELGTQRQLFVHEAPEEVALFSGGLDSVAGLYNRSRERSGSILAVSACGNEVRGHAQSNALRCLKELGANVSALKLAHQLRDTQRTRNGMESSQRSRGLLFLAMGAAAASNASLDKFSVYETGVGCINLPLSSAQVASQGTRAMHPRTLAAFNAITPLVLDRPIKAVAPFFLQTKGELCRSTGAALTQIARASMSCDEGEGHKPDMMQHCGLCTSCLFRRIALHSAKTSPDPTSYRDYKMRKHGNYELLSFESHAAAILNCTTFTDLLMIDPDVRFARVVPMENEVPSHSAETLVLEMFRRYAGEIVSFLESSRPVITSRPTSRYRKEAIRDLFVAAR